MNAASAARAIARSRSIPYLIALGVLAYAWSRRETTEEPWCTADIGKTGRVR